MRIRLHFNLAIVTLISTLLCEGVIGFKKYEGEDAWLMQFVKKLPVRKQIRYAVNSFRVNSWAELCTWTNNFYSTSNYTFPQDTPLSIGGGYLRIT